MIVVRGCTEDLLKLEGAVKTILYFAKKASSSPYRFNADLCLFYSALTWEANSRTNLDKIFIEEAMTFPIILCDYVISWNIEGIRSLNELLTDHNGKHHSILIKLV
jgi:hypothetical protein